MSVYEKHRDVLETNETMLGTARGRVAVALDLLTDALALVGQHGVYCQSARFPGKPAMDVALVLEQIGDAKELLQSVLELGAGGVEGTKPAGEGRNAAGREGKSANGPARER